LRDILRVVLARQEGAEVTQDRRAVAQRQSPGVADHLRIGGDVRQVRWLDFFADGTSSRIGREKIFPHAVTDGRLANVYVVENAPHTLTSGILPVQANSDKQPLLLRLGSRLSAVFLR
jgi:hypothetical protein